MRAVNSGNKYHIYDNTVKLYDSLPAQVYRVEFSQMQGFSLSGYKDIEIGEKVYGVHQEKEDKVLRSFKTFTRSLGVILSGDKGIGKSLFAKMLCRKAVQQGYPVVICDEYNPGIAQFIDSLDQQLVVLFDEFDKTFGGKGNDSAQASMLSLFDGVSMNKKLFCITCNSLSGLNDFLVNRPGRFHYHFRFDYPSKADIETYMRDHLPESKWGEIHKITAFAQKVELNYDCLRAIAFELLLCHTFEEAISDLNILRPDYGFDTTLYLLFDDGTRMRERDDIDAFSEEEDEMWFGDNSEVSYDYIGVKFTPADAVWSEENGGFFLPVDKLTVTEDIEKLKRSYETRFNIHKEFILAHRAKNVVGLLLRRNLNRKNIHFY